MLQLSLDFLGRTLRRLDPSPPRGARIDHVLEWENGLSVRVCFHPRARRYLLRLQSDGVARLVIPRRGTEAAGLRFLKHSEVWLIRKRAEWERQDALRPRRWQEGSGFLFRGEEVQLRLVRGENLEVCFADQIIPVKEEAPDYRPVVETHLRRLATRELPLRTRGLAAQWGITIHRISVRAQRSRWGSCSARGTISLNWRLIHAPPPVVDYLIIHELMHRREMNHSARFWKHVAMACPGYRDAEAWLKKSRLS